MLGFAYAKPNLIQFMIDAGWADDMTREHRLIGMSIHFKGFIFFLEQTLGLLHRCGTPFELCKVALCVALFSVNAQLTPWHHRLLLQYTQMNDGSIDDSLFASLPSRRLFNTPRSMDHLTLRVCEKKMLVALASSI